MGGGAVARRMGGPDATALAVGRGIRVSAAPCRGASRLDAGLGALRDQSLWAATGALPPGPPMRLGGAHLPPAVGPGLLVSVRPRAAAPAAAGEQAGEGSRPDQ